MSRELIAGVVAGGATVALLPVVISVAGFTSAGVAAGSIAAGIQAGIGNVAAGSTFAAFQSAGVLGLAATTQAAVAGAAGAAGAASAAITRLFWRR